MSKQNNLTKLTGLWVGKDSQGNSMMSGGFTYSSRIVILKNGFKEKENEPDFIMYLAPNEPKEREQADASNAPF